MRDYLQGHLACHLLGYLTVRRAGSARCVPAVGVRLAGAGHVPHRGGVPLESGAVDGAVSEAAGDGHLDEECVVCRWNGLIGGMCGSKWSSFE